jgi:hypothetical protein
MSGKVSGRIFDHHPGHHLPPPAVHRPDNQALEPPGHGHSRRGRLGLDRLPGAGRDHLAVRRVHLRLRPLLRHRPARCSTTSPTLPRSASPSPSRSPRAARTSSPGWCRRPTPPASTASTKRPIRPAVSPVRRHPLPTGRSKRPPPRPSDRPRGLGHGADLHQRHRRLIGHARPTTRCFVTSKPDDGKRGKHGT